MGVLALAASGGYHGSGLAGGSASATKVGASVAEPRWWVSEGTWGLGGELLGRTIDERICAGLVVIVRGLAQGFAPGFWLQRGG